MRFEKISLPAIFLTAYTFLFSSYSNAQQMPESVKPKNDKGYVCEGSLNLNGKPVDVLIRSRQINPGQYKFDIGRKHPYKFPNIEDGWPHAEAALQISFIVTGDNLGDDHADFVTTFNDGKYVGIKNWDVKQRKSEIGEPEITILNDAMKILEKCPNKN